MTRSLTVLAVLIAALTTGCPTTVNDFDTGPADTGTTVDAVSDLGPMDTGSIDTGSPIDIVEIAPDVPVDVPPQYDISCTDGGVACGMSCTNTSIDPMNCGRCGRACGVAQICHAGSCAANPCPSNQTPCPGDAGMTLCVDLQTSSTSCGTCGNACATDQECAAGVCVAHCTGSEVHCGAICSNRNIDPMNCGSCGHACGSGQTCVMGTCTCMAPSLACGTACVDPQTDMNNCGMCGRVCGASQYCSAGTCLTCASPSAFCGAGNCRDLTTDATNCGVCGMVCPSGNVCLGGSCICPAGSMVCSGACVNVSTDPMNCGMCGHACAAGMYCIGGTCSTMITNYRAMASPAGVSFIDACTATGHMTYLAGADDSSVRVPIPFAFRYWSLDLAAGAMINVSSNGFISMDGLANSSLGGSIPSTSTPNATIAPHWGDDYNGTPGQCIATIGTAPNRQWVVEWQNDGYCCSLGGTSLTYEIILNESGNTIDFVYGTMSGVRSQVMGIESPDGATAVGGCAGGATNCAPTTGQSVRFVPM